MSKHRLHRLKEPITQIFLLSTLYLSRMKVLKKYSFGIPMHFFTAILLSGLLATFLIGCGYTTHSLVATKYKTIYVAPFVNKTNITAESQGYKNYRKYYTLLESTITQEVISRFIFDGNLKISKVQDADLVLSGELIDYNRDAIRSTENDEVEEYRTTIKVNLKLKDQKQDKVLWQEDGFTGGTTYSTLGSLAKSEDTAIRDAISDLVRRIVERTIEEW